MVSDALDFKYLLIENYKKMNISEVELATIFVIDHFINEGNSIITTDLLSLKMSLPVNEIDNVLTNLLTRGFIEYVSKRNKTITTLNPLKKILMKNFQLSMSLENDQNEQQNKEDKLANIYKEYEKELKRNLAPVEINKIKEWFDFGYSDKQIIDALKEALSKGKRSLRSVDKVLLSWSIRNDIEEMGTPMTDSTWNKSMEETIRIAKTPWLKADDKKTKN